MRAGVRRPVLFPMPDEAPVMSIVLPSRRFAIAVAIVWYVNGGTRGLVKRVIGTEEVEAFRTVS